MLGESTVKYGSATYDIHDTFKQQGGYSDMKQAATGIYDAGTQRLGDVADSVREFASVDVLDGGENSEAMGETGGDDHFNNGGDI